MSKLWHDIGHKLRHPGRQDLTLVLIAAAGFAFRAGYILINKREVDTCGQTACGDALWYSASANVLGHLRGFEDRLLRPGEILQTAQHPPLTSIMVAPATYLGLGHNPVMQRILIAFYGTIVIVLLGLLARRLAGNRAGIVAAAIAAANPNLFMNDVVIMSETIAAICMTTLLLLTYRYIDKPTTKRVAWVGVLVGMCGLARAELLLFGPVMALPVVLMRRSLTPGLRAKQALVAGSLAVLVLVPWFAYNATRFQRPVLLSTNDGITIVGANCDAVYGGPPEAPDPGGIGFWNLSCAFDADKNLPVSLDESERSAAYREIGFDYIRSHTGRIPKVVAVRVARGWGVFGPDQMVWLNEGEGRDSWASVSGYVAWWVMMPFAVAGVVILARRKVPVWPLVSTAVVVTITLTVFYGIVRFRLPADLAGTVLMAVALDALGRAWSARRAPPADARLPPVTTGTAA